LYSYYGSNNGSPLKSAVKILKDIYSQLPDTAVIANSAVTGYGEGLIKTALNIDIGEIETIATIKQPRLPAGCEFILDIGGQDMKCLRVKMVLLTVLCLMRLVLPAADLLLRLLPIP